MHKLNTEKKQQKNEDMKMSKFRRFPPPMIDGNSFKFPFSIYLFLPFHR